MNNFNRGGLMSKKSAQKIVASLLILSLIVVSLISVGSSGKINLVQYKLQIRKPDIPKVCLYNSVDLKKGKNIASKGVIDDYDGCPNGDRPPEDAIDGYENTWAMMRGDSYIIIDLKKNYQIYNIQLLVGYQSSGRAGKISLFIENNGNWKKIWEYDKLPGSSLYTPLSYEIYSCLGDNTRRIKIQGYETGGGYPGVGSMYSLYEIYVYEAIPSDMSLIKDVEPSGENLYIFGRAIMPTPGKTIVIGGNVKVYVTEEVSTVEFYSNYIIKQKSYDQPATLNKNVFGDLKIIAYIQNKNYATMCYFSNFILFTF